VQKQCTNLRVQCIFACAAGVCHVGKLCPGSVLARLVSSSSLTKCMGRQGSCVLEGCAADLVTYCSNISTCDALALFHDGYASYSHQPAALYKTRGNDAYLDLAAYLSMHAQAVLYVKKDSWTNKSSVEYTEVRRRAA